MKFPDFHPFRSARAREEYQALYLERSEEWPVASESRLIETPSGQTFVRLSGRPEHPPLILLPGSRGTSLTWIPNILALSARYRTFALDSIYDLGLSVRCRDIKKLDDLVTWLDEVLTVLIPEGTASLVGLSYGGWLAAQYAFRFPERVHKLVLLTPAATVLPVSFALIMRALLTLIPIQGFRKQFYYWLLHDAVQSGADGKAFVDKAVADWTVGERCFRPLPLVNATVMDDTQLEGIKVPTLFLVGEHEKVYSPQRAVGRILRVASHIRTAIIPRAGHDLWFVQAEVVTGRILGFLGDPDNGRADVTRPVQ